MKNEQKPVVWLDFDGVLHPLDTAALSEDGQILRNPALFCWLPLLEEALKPFPDVKIIVSSDWRRLCTDGKLIELLGPLGERFAGVLETRGGGSMAESDEDARLQRLERWLAQADPASVPAAKRGEGFPLVELLAGLSGRFDGLRAPAAGRASEILADARRRGLDRWIALDDHASVRAAEAAGDPRFIACDPLRGISDESVLARLRAALELRGNAG